MDRYKKEGFLGTLDYSLCYEHIDPRVICEAMKELDIPEDLAALLADVWTNMKRFVIFENECTAEAYEAGKMIMQGDSFGPFALHLLMTAGVSWVKKEVQKATDEAPPEQEHYAEEGEETSNSDKTSESENQNDEDVHQTQAKRAQAKR